MKRNFNQTGFVIAAAAALIIGFSGNAQAMPISSRNLPTAGAQTSVLMPHGHGTALVSGQVVQGQQVTHSVTQNGSSSQTAARGTASRSSSVTAHTVQPGNTSGSRNTVTATPTGHTTPTRPHGNSPSIPVSTVPGLITMPVIGLNIPVGPSTITTPVVISTTYTPVQITPTRPVVPIAGAATNVVPDGGTTAVMLAGAFCGLVFLKRSFKPARPA